MNALPFNQQIKLDLFTCALLINFADVLFLTRPFYIESKTAPLLEHYKFEKFTLYEWPKTWHTTIILLEVGLNN